MRNPVSPLRSRLALAFSLGALVSCRDAPATQQSVSLEAMRAAAEAATPEMAQFLSETVAFASVEPEGPTLLPETEALLDHVLAKGEALGFTSRRAANGLVGVLEVGRGDETVGVLIHLDVVPPGELSEWERPPFSGEIADGRVFGRGAQDDKGALPGVLWGAKILIDEGMTFDRGLRIVLGTKEETSFEDVRTYFAEERPPDYGIAPDGPFVVRGESGYLDVAYAFAGLADAPADRRDAAVYWDGGTVINSVPDFSFLVLRSRDRDATRAEVEAIVEQVTAEFTRGNKVPDLEVVDYESFVRERGLEGLPPGDLVLVSHGEIAHSSIPATGRNAIVEIALVGARMTQLADGAFRRAFQFVDERVGLSTDGSGFDLSVEKPGAGADTTASLDLARTDVAADRVELAINFRVGVANTTAEIEAKSQDVARDYGATTRRLGAAFDAYYYADDNPLLQLAVGSYREVRGVDPPLLALGSTTYAKAAPNLVGYGPVDLVEDGLYFHTPNEQFPIASLTRNAVLYAHVLQKMIQAPTSPIRAP